jgi:uncharacterized membrane protein YhaH (DUF805 family)
MLLLRKLFIGRLNRNGFWTTILLSQLALHAVIITLTFFIYEGNPLTNVYTTTFLLDNFFPDLKIAFLWPVALLTWLVVTFVSTGAFARRLADIKVTKVLTVAFPITAAWLTFFGFQTFGGTLVNFNEESSSFVALVVIIYAAGFFTLVASLLPSKK